MKIPYSPSSCPEPLRPSSLTALLSSRAWYDSSGHQGFLYYARVLYTYHSMTAPNLAHRFRLPQASVSVVPVTTRTHLDMSRWIISSLSTGKTLGDLSTETRRHDIIAQMVAQGGFLFTIYSVQRYSSSRICYNSENKWLHHFLSSFASAPTGLPSPPRRRATTLTTRPEILRGDVSGTSSYKSKVLCVCVCVVCVWWGGRGGLRKYNSYLLTRSMRG